MRLLVLIYMIFCVSSFTDAQTTGFPSPKTADVYIVGTGGVTANQLVKLDSTSNSQTVIKTATADSQALGIAASTVSAGGTVLVYFAGSKIACVMDNTTTIGNLATISATVASECSDSGVSSSQSLAVSKANLGVIQSVATAGNLALIQLYGPGFRGDSSSAGLADCMDTGGVSFICTVPISAPSYSSTGTTPGASSLSAGTGSIPALAANSAGFAAPASGGTAYLFKLPPTIAKGILHTAAPATNDGVNESALTSSLVSMTADVAGVLPVANGGTGTATPGIVAGTNVTITGTWPNQTINSSGGGGTTLPRLIPRDTNVHDMFVNVDQNSFTYLGSNYASLTTNGFNGTPDALGYTYATQSSGTTANTAIGWAANTANILMVATNPSFRVIGFISAASGINSWVAICRGCSTNEVDPGVSFRAAIGFRHFSGTESTNWTCYSSDASSGVTGTTMDTGVAVSTTQAQIFDVVYVSGAPQFFINNTRVCNTFVTTHLPDVLSGLNILAQNTTTTSVTMSLARAYVGTN